MVGVPEEEEGGDNNERVRWKKARDPEESSEYSNSHVGTSSMVEEMQNKYKFSNRFFRDSDFRPNRSLISHCIILEKER